MNYTEQILIDLELPSFANNFKSACLGNLIYPIDTAIEGLKNASNPVLMVLLIILFIQLIRLAILQARQQRNEQNRADASDSHLVSKQIKDLKRQLKSVQKTFQQLKQIGIKSGVSEQGSKISAQIIESCKLSWQKREEIAQHILEYQIKLMQEVKKLKKANRYSSPSKSKIQSGSKQSIIKSISKDDIVVQKQLSAQPLFKQTKKQEYLVTDKAEKSQYNSTGKLPFHQTIKQEKLAPKMNIPKEIKTPPIENIQQTSNQIEISSMINTNLNINANLTATSTITTHEETIYGQNQVAHHEQTKVEQTTVQINMGLEESKTMPPLPTRTIPPRPIRPAPGPKGGRAPPPPPVKKN